MSNVLIVEDEILEREFLKSLVEEKLSKNDKLFTCETGVQAIELAKKHKTNIIIMDILVPEMDGLAAIEKIRTFLPDACITILSAYSDFSYAQKAINLNVFKYLLKPVRPNDFQDVLQEMLDNSERCDSQIEEDFHKKAFNPKEHQKCFINKSIKYIEKNFKDKLTLEEVASEAFVNPKYFSRIFKEETGTSFSNYVNDLKIQHACMLLKTTDYPAYRISMECGFSDPSYFNRVFKSSMDMTPIAYRKYSRALEKKVEVDL